MLLWALVLMDTITIFPSLKHSDFEIGFEISIERSDISLIRNKFHNLYDITKTSFTTFVI